MMQSINVEFATLQKKRWKIHLLILANVLVL